MGVISYKDEIDGKEYFSVSVHVRSKLNRKIRAQKKLIKIPTRKEADQIFLDEYKKACVVVAKREAEGHTWAEVIYAWELWYNRYPSTRWDKGTVLDYIALTKNWTSQWYDRPVSKLTVADGFQLIQEAREKGASTQRLYQIKTTINTIFKWGVMSGKVIGNSQSPMFGIELKKRDDDPLGEIMNRDEVAELLHKAEACEDDWYPVWFTAAYTGMRSGELEGLRKPDLELVTIDEARRLDASSIEKKNYGFIRVQRQYARKIKDYGPTKGRMARTVPVSRDLYWFLVDYLQNDFGSDEHGARVFPILDGHRTGQQARILKYFCEARGLRQVKFHTFRACFATHLLAAGVPEIQVMKVGGWKDRETMMMYVRRAGVDEAGATAKLDFKKRAPEVLPAVGSNVISLFAQR